MSYFTFKGISSENLGLMITKTITPPASAIQYEIQSVPGRDIPLWTEKKERQQIEISVEAAIIEPNMIRTIYNKLQGHGIITFSNEPDKYYIGSINQLIPQHIAVYMKVLPIVFVCEPYAYSVNNTPITLESSGTVTVKSPIPCEPTIKIYGNGYIELSVNGEIWCISDVEESITLDTKRMLAYKNNTVLLNKISRKDNKVYLPMLNAGNNFIAASGNVTSIDVTKNERWL